MESLVVCCCSYLALVPTQYMMPFSSKSCWCLKVKVCPSLSFLTKTKEERSKSYHCFATWRTKRSCTFFLYKKKKLLLIQGSQIRECVAFLGLILL